MKTCEIFCAKKRQECYALCGSQASRWEVLAIFQVMQFAFVTR